MLTADRHMWYAHRVRIAIVGPGAIGCTLGAYLTRGGLDVVLLHRDRESAEALARSGIRVEGVRGDLEVEARAAWDAGAVGPVDVVVVAVKACDTAAAMRAHSAAVGPATAVVTLQNGIGNVEAIAGIVGAQRVLGGTTTMGCRRLGPGRVRHAGEGDTFVGEVGGGVSERAERIAATLTAAGVPARAVSDVASRIWSKLAVNAGINALTALLGVPNGFVVRDADADSLLEAAVLEAAAVAGAAGVPLDGAQTVSMAREVARRTAANRSSMLSDIEAGRRTEIDRINGAVARLGERRGVATPVNAVLAALVRALEGARAAEARR